MLLVTFQEEMNSSSRLAMLFLSNDRREYFENCGHHLQMYCLPSYKCYLLIVEWKTCDRNTTKGQRHVVLIDDETGSGSELSTRGNMEIVWLYLFLAFST